METSTLDAVIVPAADKLTPLEIDLARQALELQLEHSAWNMNQRLNMIAYEDRA